MKFVTNDRALKEATGKLSESDLEMLRTMVDGKNLVQITPELLEEMKGDFTASVERMNDLEKAYDNLPEIVKIVVLAKAFKELSALAALKDGGSFRYLIYDRLGLSEKAYVPLYLSGGMNLSNNLKAMEIEGP